MPLPPPGRAGLPAPLPGGLRCPCCSQQVNDHQTWTLFKALREMTGHPTTEEQAEEQGLEWTL